jgi:hypothetical protein
MRSYQFTLIEICCVYIIIITYFFSPILFSNADINNNIDVRNDIDSSNIRPIVNHHPNHSFHNISWLEYEFNNYSNDGSTLPGKSGQQLADQPVYISLTTILKRLHRVVDTLKTFLFAPYYPTRIYLFVSSDPYLLDGGIKQVR